MSRRAVTFGDITEGLGLHQTILRFLQFSSRVEDAPSWIATAMQMYCGASGPQPTLEDRWNLQIVNFYFLRLARTMGCFDEAVLFLSKVVFTEDLCI